VSKKLTDFTSVVIWLAAIGYVMSPGRNSAKILKAATNESAQWIKYATSGNVVKDMRTAAEKFHEKAMEAIGEFWSGFNGN